jgi:chemotaxis protein MotB
MRLATLLLVFAACGIPEQVHTQTVRDLEKCRQDLATVRNDLSIETNRLDEERAMRAGGGVTPAEDPSVNKKDLEVLARAREATTKRHAQEQRLLLAVKPLADKGLISVGPRKGRLTIRLPEKSLFDVGRAELKTDAQKTLVVLARALADMPDRELLVAAHTDPAPPPREGKFRSNWELSTARAVAIVQLLQGEGVDPRRLGAVGRSEFDPDGSNGARVEIMLLLSPSEIPETSAQ